MIPSLDALGGWGRRPRNAATTVLSDLYTPSWRFVDTPYFDYKSFLRSSTGAAYTSLSLNPGIPLLPGTRIGIIGGGAAGLIAAYELVKLGAAVTIYEATDRFGGRLYTRSYSASMLAEMGAMRVPESARLFWHYLGQMLPGNTPMTAFPNPGVVATLLNFGPTLQTWGGASGGSPGGIFDTIIAELLHPATGAYNTQIVYDGVTIDDIYNILASAAPTSSQLETVAEWWRKAVDQFDKKSFLEATLELAADAGYIWDHNKIEAFATLGFGTGGFGPLFSVSFLDILRLIIWRYDTEYEVPGGMTALVTWLLKQIVDISFANGNPAALRHSTPIDLVQTYFDRATVRTSTGNVETHDFVLATGTARGMQRYGLDLNGQNLPFDPANVTQPLNAPIPANLVSSVQTGMREVNMVGASKVFVHYTAKPWVTHGNWPKNAANEPVKTVLTDKFFRQSYFLDPTPGTGGVVGLISYAWNNESTKVAALTPIQRLGLYHRSYVSAVPGTGDAMEVIGQSFNGSIVNTALSISWENEPYLLGGFKLDAPGGYYHTAALVNHYTLAACNIGSAAVKWQRVYLAGDTISFYGGWVEGAMMSAINAVTAIVNARNVYTYPEMQNAIRSAAVMDWKMAWGYTTTYGINWTRIGTV